MELTTFIFVGLILMLVAFCIVVITFMLYGRSSNPEVPLQIAMVICVLGMVAATLGVIWKVVSVLWPLLQ